MVDKMDEAFAVMLDNYSITPGKAKLIKETIVRTYRKIHSDVVEDRDRRLKLRASIEKKKDRLLDLLISETISRKTYEEKLNPIQAELAQVIMEEQDSIGDIMLLQEDLEAVLEFLFEPGKFWRKSSPDKKKELQAILLGPTLRWTREEGFLNTSKDKATNGLNLIGGPKTKLASLWGFEPQSPA